MIHPRVSQMLHKWAFPLRIGEARQRLFPVPFPHLSLSPSFPEGGGGKPHTHILHERGRGAQEQRSVEQEGACTANCLNLGPSQCAFTISPITLEDRQMYVRAVPERFMIPTAAAAQMTPQLLRKKEKTRDDFSQLLPPPPLSRCGTRLIVTYPLGWGRGCMTFKGLSTSGFDHYGLGII